MSMEQYGNPQAPDPVLLNIGDIAVTPHWVITPQGRRPVREVYWTLTDMSRTHEEIPTWAIVLAIVFFVFCLLGLLFLLAKESRTDGWVQVSVQGNNFYHTVNLPVSNPYAVQEYMQMVNYARFISAGAGRW
jgi:hypothetical protein